MSKERQPTDGPNKSSSGCHREGEERKTNSLMTEVQTAIAEREVGRQ